MSYDPRCDALAEVFLAADERYTTLKASPSRQAALRAGLAQRIQDAIEEFFAHTELIP